MSTFNSQNFKIGLCAVIYKREVLGISRDSSHVNFNSIYHDTTSARAYKQSLAKRLLSMTLTFTTEVMEIDKSLGMFLDENERITLDGLGEKASGGKLLLIPINPSDMVAYHFPNALLIYDGTFSFNGNKEHSLRLQFEASFDEREVLFERIPVDEGLRVSLENPLTIEPAALERAMTAYIADKMNMTVDTDIFRGGVPVNIDGCGVEIVGQETQSTLTSQRYIIRVSSIDSSRDKVMKTINDLASKFPVYGEIIAFEGIDTECKAILKNSSEYAQEISDNGKIKTRGEAVLIVIL